MRYFNCKKKNIFEFFDQGMIPSKIYDKAKVKKHTLFNYYQQWKREQEKLVEEANRKRLAKEEEEKLRNEKLQKELQLQGRYRLAKKELWGIALSSRWAKDEAESDKIQRDFQEALSKLCHISLQLYPDCTDISSVLRKMHDTE